MVESKRIAKFKTGDNVIATVEGKSYPATIVVVDYGTFYDPDEIQYDVLVSDGDLYNTIIKHIYEKRIRKPRLYVSLPIAIDEKTVALRWRKSMEDISCDELLSQYEIYGPININDFDENGLTKERTHDYAWYMGEDVKILLNCDAIYMSTGWANSLGCNCELQVAKTYNKEVFYQ